MGGSHADPRVRETLWDCLADRQKLGGESLTLPSRAQAQPPVAFVSAVGKEDWCTEAGVMVEAG
jgi:hypothetical protein